MAHFAIQHTNPLNYFPTLECDQIWSLFISGLKIDSVPNFLTFFRFLSFLLSRYHLFNINKIEILERKYRGPRTPINHQIGLLK